MRLRVACTSGDGALVRGGPRARHGSSGALNMLWDTLHPPEARVGHAGKHCATWDGFHRLEVAYRRAQAPPLCLDAPSWASHVPGPNLKNTSQRLREKGRFLGMLVGHVAAPCPNMPNPRPMAHFPITPQHAQPTLKRGRGPNMPNPCQTRPQHAQPMSNHIKARTGEDDEDDAPTCATHVLARKTTRRPNMPNPRAQHARPTFSRGPPRDAPTCPTRSSKKVLFS